MKWLAPTLWVVFTLGLVSNSRADSPCADLLLNSVSEDTPVIRLLSRMLEIGSFRPENLRTVLGESSPDPQVNAILRAARSLRREGDTATIERFISRIEKEHGIAQEARADAAQATARVWFAGAITDLGSRPSTRNQAKSPVFTFWGKSVQIMNPETRDQVDSVRVPGRVINAEAHGPDLVWISYRTSDYGEGREIILYDTTQKCWLQFPDNVKVPYPASDIGFSIVRDPSGNGGLISLWRKLPGKKEPGKKEKENYHRFDAKGVIDPEPLLGVSKHSQNDPHFSRRAGPNSAEVVISDGGVVSIVDIHDERVRRYPESANAKRVESHVIERANGLADYLLRYSLDGKTHVELLRTATGELIPVSGFDLESVDFGVKYRSYQRYAAQTSLGELTTLAYMKEKNKWFHAIIRIDDASVLAEFEAPKDWGDSFRTITPVETADGRLLLEFAARDFSDTEWVRTIEISAVPK